MAEARALFEEANKFEPEYSTYARDLAYYLLPRWSGKAGDTEKFVQEIADRIGGDTGDILYFQVAAANYVICGCDQNPQLSWDRIKRGFEASEKHTSPAGRERELARLSSCSRCSAPKTNIDFGRPITIGTSMVQGRPKFLAIPVPVIYGTEQ